MREMPGFLGHAFYEIIDNPDGLVETASGSRQRRARPGCIQDGTLAPFMAVLGAPFKATNVQQMP